MVIEGGLIWIWSTKTWKKLSQIQYEIPVIDTLSKNWLIRGVMFVIFKALCEAECDHITNKGRLSASRPRCRSNGVNWPF